MFITLNCSNAKDIRCDQVGDWHFTGEGEKMPLWVNVDNRLPYKSQILVAIHEMVEAILCNEAGITDQQVVAFDLQFEKERAAGLHAVDAEDGNDPRAPYHDQHIEATAVEMMMCSLLGMSWREHENNLRAIQ